ncbi:MAG TPA: response regulator transcription factor [Terracidiphilus sp.]|nr:response regulator transcription factor [Terracidiphilus sp.]
MADDHLVYRIGIRSLVGNEPGMSVVGEASDGASAIELYRKLRPDVMLLDLRMPHQGGIDVVQTIRAEFPDARILIVTSYQTEEEVYQALRAGALGYLLKDMGREMLIDAIRSAHAGVPWISPTIEKQFAERALREQLTAREVEVMRLLAKGLTNREIASAFNISESTVKNHVNSLLAKLEVTDRTEAVTLCLVRGIVTLEDI